MSSTDDTRQYYEFLAKLYDKATANATWIPNEVLADELSALSSTVNTVLDLGTGTGQTMQAMAKLFPKAQCTGVDFSPTMIKTAQAKFPNAKFVVVDLSEYVKNNNQTFDLITAIGCLEFIPGLPDLLPRILDRLAPNGYLALTFEPVVEGLSHQSERVTKSDVHLGKDYSFTTYRWSLAEVLQALDGSNVISSRFFEAYTQGENPVLYVLLVVHKSAQ